MERRRFTGREISLLRYLACASGFTPLSEPSRVATLPLWRRGIVHCVYLQVPDHDRALQGPFFQLTGFGRQVALMFVRTDAGAARSHRPLSRAARNDLNPGGRRD